MKLNKDKCHLFVNSNGLYTNIKYSLCEKLFAINFDYLKGINSQGWTFWTFRCNFFSGISFDLFPWQPLFRKQIPSTQLCSLPIQTIPEQMQTEKLLQSCIFCRKIFFKEIKYKLTDHGFHYNLIIHVFFKLENRIEWIDT